MNLKTKRIRLAAFAILSIVIHIGMISVSAYCLENSRHFTKHLRTLPSSEAEPHSGIQSLRCPLDLVGSVLTQASRTPKERPGENLGQNELNLGGSYRLAYNAPSKGFEHSSHPLFQYPGVPLHQLKVTYLI